MEENKKYLPLIPRLGAHITIWLADLLGFKEFANANRAAFILVTPEPKQSKFKTYVTIGSYIIVAIIIYKLYKLIKR